MDYPKQANRQTYRCSLFRLTCIYGLSKQLKNMNVPKQIKVTEENGIILAWIDIPTLSSHVTFSFGSMKWNMDVT